VGVQDLLLQGKPMNQIVSKGSIFGFLIAGDSEKKYSEFLAASSNHDLWEDTLTSLNMIILDGFRKLRHSVRLRLVELLEYVITVAPPAKIANVLTHFFRELNSGWSLL
jgi:hypothetical protein